MQTKNWWVRNELRVAWACYLILASIPLFMHLDAVTFYSWDESLFAMRTYHMLEEGAFCYNFNYYEGYGYHPNLKPPLTSILQILSWKLFGYSALGLRLPIGLLALLTGGILVRVFQSRFSSIWTGVLAGLILVSNTGYIRVHVARSGDQDVATTLYMLLIFLGFYLFMEATEEGEKRRYLWLTGLAMAAALFTKTIFAFLFLPGFFLYALYTKQLWSTLRRWDLWAIAGGLIASFVLYNVYMEWQSPGFVEDFIKHALGRYVVIVDQHQEQPFFFYFIRLWEETFWPWVVLLPIPIVLAFSGREHPYRRLSALATFCAVTYLLIHSYSKTKLSWYDAPFYPLGAMLAAIGFSLLWKELRAWGAQLVFLPRATFLAYFAVLILIPPYIRTIQSIYLPEITLLNEKFGEFMEKTKKQRPALTDYTVVAKPYNPQASFMATLYNDQFDYQIEVLDNVKHDYEIGETVLACHRSFLGHLYENYELDLVDVHDECQMLTIRAKKTEVED